MGVLRNLSENLYSHFQDENASSAARTGRPWQYAFASNCATRTRTWTCQSATPDSREIHGQSVGPNAGVHDRVSGR